MNLEAYAELISLLKPFFPDGWSSLPSFVTENTALYLSHQAGTVLANVGELKQSMDVHGALLAKALDQENWTDALVLLANYAWSLGEQNKLALQNQAALLSFDLASLLNEPEELFIAHVNQFYQFTCMGQWVEAEKTWRLLEPMNRPWSRDSYSAGRAEAIYAQWHFWQGDMPEEHLLEAERLAHGVKDRQLLRQLHALRGAWCLEQGLWARAEESLQEAVIMARAVGRTDAEAETLLALTRFHLGQFPNPREEAEQLAKLKQPAHCPLAELWHALGDPEQATKHALEAYKSAWADGEPYVYRYELNKASALLET